MGKERVGAKRNDKRYAPLISSKNQITLPVEIIRRMGLRPGDRLELQIDEEGQRIVLVPRRTTADFHHLSGSLKGAWGGLSGDDFVDALRGEVEDD